MMGRAWAYLAIIALALGIAWATGIDAHVSEGDAADKAGDKLSWKAHDKRWHFGLAAVLTGLAVLFGVHPGGAIVVTVLAGIGWELMQRYPRNRMRGYFSVADVIADAMGAVVGALLAWLFVRGG